MSTTVTTAKELGSALKKKESTIYIEGRLGNAVIAIKAVGPVTWGLVLGAISVSITGIVITVGTVGAGAPVGVAAETVATKTLIASFSGVTKSALTATAVMSTTAATTGSVTAATVATTALGIAIAGGGIGAIKSLRGYVVKKGNNKLVLTKR